MVVCGSFFDVKSPPTSGEVSLVLLDMLVLEVIAVVLVIEVLGKEF